VTLRDLSLELPAGRVVGLAGLEGSGQQILLRLLAGRARPTRGNASLGVGARPAYFAQDQSEHLDPANTAFDEVYQAAPASWDIQAVRDLLGRFLFTGDEQFKSVSGLSGGERSRVALAKLLLRPSNLLLLDEPTNHLDIATRERLEDTLSAYPGTLVVATHDRYLVNRLATKVIEVADRGIRVYPGTYADYQRAHAAVVESAEDELPPPTSRPRATAAQQDPALRRRLAADLREAERQVTVVEERLKAVEAILSDPAAYTGDLATLAREHATLQGQVAELTERWAELAEAAEGAA
jgi:ATP-binding cassette subfamily F protein 3